MKLDLSEVATAEEAAQKLFKYLKKYGKDEGADSGIGGGASLHDPESSKDLGYGNCWCIIWEEGPFEWTMSLTGGCGLFDFSNCKYSGSGEEVKFDAKNWHPEPHNSHVLCFYDD